MPTGVWVLHLPERQYQRASGKGRYRAALLAWISWFQLPKAVISFFWDCGEKAVLSVIGIGPVRPNNLSGIIDAVGVWAGALRRIDGRVLAVAVDKGVLCRDPLGAADLVIADDLSFITDAYGIGVNSAGKFDKGVTAIAVYKALPRPAATRYELSDDRSKLVDGMYDAVEGTWGFDRCVSAVAVKKAMQRAPAPVIIQVSA